MPERHHRDRRQDRAIGCLLGGALGDALGMPTQSLSRSEIHETYGHVTDFLAPVADHPIAKGLVAGAVTDDTEQSLLLARRMIASPNEFDEVAWARSLMEWEDSVRRRGRYDLLGPSTKRAFLALTNGEPASKAGIDGDTNGAAMRAGPIGIATPPEPLSGLVDEVVRFSRITHNTNVAIAAASAVAAAISAGIDGASPDDSTGLAMAAARESANRGAGQRGADIAARIAEALTAADLGAEEVSKRIGTSVASEESVPTAFAVLKMSAGDAWNAGLIGANIGGDTDTIAAIAGSMAGACGGTDSVPEDRTAFLLSVNQLDFEEIASALIDIRSARDLGDYLVERVV